jgi:hypothetical protein
MILLDGSFAGPLAARLAICRPPGVFRRSMSLDPANSAEFMVNVGLKPRA